MSTLVKNIGNIFRKTSVPAQEKTTNYGFTFSDSNGLCKLGDAETSLVVEGEKLKQIIN